VTRGDRASVEALATSISTALSRAGIHAVLSGGAAVTVYSDGRYQSADIDFVTNETLALIAPVMERLGFRKGPGRHFEHPDHELVVEFVAGPLAFGEDEIGGDHAMREHPDGTLLIVTPTQCVMDRLAAAFHWNDPQAREQALLVAARQELDLDRLRRWARREGRAEDFDRFVSELSART